MTELTIDELESVSGGAAINCDDTIYNWRICPGQSPPTIEPPPKL